MPKQSHPQCAVANCLLNGKLLRDGAREAWKDVPPATKIVIVIPHMNVVGQGMESCIQNGDPKCSQSKPPISDSLKLVTFSPKSDEKSRWCNMKDIKDFLKDSYDLLREYLQILLNLILSQQLMILGLVITGPRLSTRSIIAKANKVKETGPKFAPLWRRQSS